MLSGSACTPHSKIPSVVVPANHHHWNWLALSTCKVNSCFLIFVLLLHHFSLVDCFFVSVVLWTMMQCHPRVLFPIYFFFAAFPSFSKWLLLVSLASGFWNYFLKLSLTPCFCFCTTIQPAGLLIVAHHCPTMPQWFRWPQKMRVSCQVNFFLCFTAGWLSTSIFLITYPFLLPLFLEVVECQDGGLHGLPNTSLTFSIILLPPEWCNAHGDTTMQDCDTLTENSK